VKRILCSLLVATLPFGSVLADAPKSKNAKVTLVPARAAELGPVGYVCCMVALGESGH